jgi:hypothetical protein
MTLSSKSAAEMSWLYLSGSHQGEIQDQYAHRLAWRVAALRA